MSTMDPGGEGGGGGETTIMSATNIEQTASPVTPVTGTAVTPGSHQQHPPPSPLSGCYLLVVLPEPHTAQHKDLILNRLAKGFLSWDKDSCHVDLEKELLALVAQAPEGEEARNGERLIQYATENLVTEVLIHPQTNTLLQCIRNLLASFTKHRHIIHAGYTFGGNGSWILQDGTFSLADFLDAFSEHEVQRVLRAYENSVTVDIHCAGVGDWTTNRLSKEACTRVRVNPDDVLTAGLAAIASFTDYVGQYLVAQTLDQLMEPSDVVGNIRFSHPTLYVFPGGQGDAALFGINGFNMLVDGGFARKACFWDFTRHLDRLDAVLLTRVNNSNVGGMSSVLRKKKEMHVYPQIGHFFCNLVERRQSNSPDGDKDIDPLILNLTDIGQEMVVNLRHINLRAHPCYRDPDPINLYHKVGHGTLDMYVLSPNKDSREVREFLTKWHTSDSKLFAGGHKKDSNNLAFPIQNLVSICALLVWQPANPEDTITRILFPGSTPQQRIFEGFERLKHLEFLKHPVCSAKSLSPSASLATLRDKPALKQKLGLIEKESSKKMIAADTTTTTTKKERKEQTDAKITQGTTPIIPTKPQTVKTEVKGKKAAENKRLEAESKKIEKDSKETKKDGSGRKEVAKTEKADKAEEERSTEKREEERKAEPVKPDAERIGVPPAATTTPKEAKSKGEQQSGRKRESKEGKVGGTVKSGKIEVAPKSRPPDKTKAKQTAADKRDASHAGVGVKSSPTTPKKTVNGAATKTEISKASAAKGKQTVGGQKSAIAHPAKSTKDANNRKVVEQKKQSAIKETGVKVTAKPKPMDRKPIGRRGKAVSPSKVRVAPAGGSPAKSTRSTPTASVKSDKDGVVRKPKPDKGTADSSTVSTPSGIEAESTGARLVEKRLMEQAEDLSLDSIESKVLADLKEEREVVEEIEAVLQKAERGEETRKDDRSEGDDEITAELTDKKEEDVTEDEIIEAEIEDDAKRGDRFGKGIPDLIDEYLIVEKEEDYTEESTQSGEGEQKHVLDEAESEKVKMLKDMESVKEKGAEEEVEEKEKDESVERRGPDGITDTAPAAALPIVVEEERRTSTAAVEPIDLSPVDRGERGEPEEEPMAKEGIAGVAETVQQRPEEKDDSGKKDSDDITKELSSFSPDKFDSFEKKTTDTDFKPEAEQKEQIPEKLEESQERISTVESGATTTAPTLPEDERIPLDEINEEDIDEKHVIEEVKEKEKDAPAKVKEEAIVTVARSQPPAAVPVKPEMQVFDVRQAVQSLQRDIVKTPDEVADLPVHEEVDPKFYRMEDFEKDKEEKPIPAPLTQEVKEPPTPPVKEQKGVFSFFGKVADKFEKGIDKLTKKSRKEQEREPDDKSSSKSSSPKEVKTQEKTLLEDVDMEKVFPKVGKPSERTQETEATSVELSAKVAPSISPESVVVHAKRIEETVTMELDATKVDAKPPAALPITSDLPEALRGAKTVTEEEFHRKEEEDTGKVTVAAEEHRKAEEEEEEEKEEEGGEDEGAEEDAEEIKALLEEASKKFKTVKDSLRDSLESLEGKIEEETVGLARDVPPVKDAIKDTLEGVAEKLEAIKPRIEAGTTKEPEKVKFDIPKDADASEVADVIPTRDVKEAVRDVGEVLAGTVGIDIDDKPKDVTEIVRKVAQVLKEDDLLSDKMLFAKVTTAIEEKEKGKIASPTAIPESSVAERVSREVAILPTKVGITEEIPPHREETEELVAEPSVEKPCLKLTKESERVESPEREAADMRDVKRICDESLIAEKCSVLPAVEPAISTVDVAEAGLEDACVRESVKPPIDREQVRGEIEVPVIGFDQKISPAKAEIVVVSPGSTPTSPKFAADRTQEGKVASAKELTISFELPTEITAIVDKADRAVEEIVEELVSKKKKITVQIIEYITIVKCIPRERVIYFIEEIIARRGHSEMDIVDNVDTLKLDESITPRLRTELEEFIIDEYVAKGKRITVQIVEEISVRKFVPKTIVTRIIREIVVKRCVKIPTDGLFDPRLDFPDDKETDAEQRPEQLSPAAGRKEVGKGEEVEEDGFVSIGKEIRKVSMHIADGKGVYPVELEDAKPVVGKTEEKDLVDDFEAVEQEYKVPDLSIAPLDMARVSLSKPDAEGEREYAEEATEDTVGDVVEADEKWIVAPPSGKIEKDPSVDAPEADEIRTVETDGKTPEGIDTAAETTERSETIDTVEKYLDEAKEKTEEKIKLEKREEKTVSSMETEREGVERTIKKTPETEVKVKLAEIIRPAAASQEPVIDKVVHTEQQLVGKETDLDSADRITESPERLTKVVSPALPETEEGKEATSSEMRVAVDETLRTKLSEIVEDVGSVRRMLVTAASEDGGHETEISGTDAIALPRAITPDDSLKEISVKSTPDKDSLLLDKDSLHSGISSPEKDSISDKSPPTKHVGKATTPDDSLDRSPTDTRDSCKLEESLEKVVQKTDKPKETEDGISTSAIDKETFKSLAEPGVFDRKVESVESFTDAAVKISDTVGEKRKFDEQMTEDAVLAPRELFVDTETLDKISAAEVSKSSQAMRSEDVSPAETLCAKSPTDKHEELAEISADLRDEGQVKLSTPTTLETTVPVAEAVERKVAASPLVETLHDIRQSQEKETVTVEIGPADLSKKKPISDAAEIEVPVADVDGLAKKEKDDAMRSPSVDSDKAELREVILSKAVEVKADHSEVDGKRVAQPKTEPKLEHKDADMKELTHDICKTDTIAESEKAGDKLYEPKDALVSDKRSEKPTDSSKPSLSSIADKDKVSGIATDARGSNDTDTKVIVTDKSPSVSSTRGGAADAPEKSRTPSTVDGHMSDPKGIDAQLADKGRSPSVTSVPGDLKETSEKSKSPSIASDISSLKDDDTAIVDKARSSSVTTITGEVKDTSDKSKPPSIASMGRLEPQDIDGKLTESTTLPSVTGGPGDAKEAFETSEVSSVAVSESADQKDVEAKLTDVPKSPTATSVAGETKDTSAKSISPGIEGEMPDLEDADTILSDKTMSPSATSIPREVKDISDKPKSPSIADDMPDPKDVDIILSDKSKSPSVTSIPGEVKLTDQSRSPSVTSVPGQASDASDKSKSPSITEGDIANLKDVDAKLTEKAKYPSVTSVPSQIKDVSHKLASPSIVDGNTTILKDIDTIFKEKSKSPSGIDVPREVKLTDTPSALSVTSGSVEAKVLLEKPTSPSIASGDLSDLKIVDAPIADKSTTLGVTSVPGDTKEQSVKSQSPSISGEAPDLKDIETNLTEKSRSPSVTGVPGDAKEPSEKSKSPSIAGEAPHLKDIETKLSEKSRSPSVTSVVGDAKESFEKSKSPSATDETPDLKDVETKLTEKSRTPSVTSVPGEEPSEKSKSPSIAGEASDLKDIETKLTEKSRSPSVTSVPGDAKQPSEKSKSPSVADEASDLKDIETKLSEKSSSPSVTGAPGEEPSEKSKSPSIAGEPSDLKDIETKLSEKSRSPSVTSVVGDAKESFEKSKSPSATDETPDLKDVETKLTEKSRTPSVTSVPGEEPSEKSKSPSIAGEASDLKDIETKLTEKSRSPSVTSVPGDAKQPSEKSKSPSVADEASDLKDIETKLSEKSSSPSVTGAPGEEPSEKSKSPSIAGEPSYLKDIETKLSEKSRSPSVTSVVGDAKESFEKSKSPSATDETPDLKDVETKLTEKSRTPSVTSVPGEEPSEKSKSPSIAGEPSDLKDIERKLTEKSRSPSVTSVPGDAKEPSEESKSPSVAGEAADLKDIGTKLAEESRSPRVTSVPGDTKEPSEKSKSPSVASEALNLKDIETKLREKPRSPSVTSVVGDAKEPSEKSKSPSATDETPDLKDIETKLGEKSRSPSVTSVVGDAKEPSEKSKSPSATDETPDLKDIEIKLTEKSRSPSVTSVPGDAKEPSEKSESPSLAGDAPDVKDIDTKLTEKSRSSSDPSAPGDVKEPSEKSKSPSVAGETPDLKDIETKLSEKSRSPSVTSVPEDAKEPSEKSKSPTVAGEAPDLKDMDTKLAEKSRSPSVASVLGDTKESSVKSQSPSVAAEAPDLKDIDTKLTEKFRSPSVTSIPGDAKEPSEKAKSPSVAGETPDLKDIDTKLAEKSRSPSVTSFPGDAKELSVKSQSSSVTGEASDLIEVETKLSEKSRSPSVPSAPVDAKEPSEKSKSPSISGEVPDLKDIESKLTEKSRSPSVTSVSGDAKEPSEKSKSPSVAGEASDFKDMDTKLSEKSRSLSVTSVPEDAKEPSEKSKSPSVAGKASDFRGIETKLTEKSISPSVPSVTGDAKEPSEKSKTPSICGEAPDLKDIESKLTEKSRSPSVPSVTGDAKEPSEKSKTPSISGEAPDLKDIESKLTEKSRSPSVPSVTGDAKEPSEKSKTPSISGEAPDLKDIESKLTEKSRSSSVTSVSGDAKEPSERSKSPSVAGEASDFKDMDTKLSEKSRSPSVPSVTGDAKEPSEKSKTPSISGEAPDLKDIESKLTEKSRSPSVTSVSGDAKEPSEKSKSPSVAGEAPDLKGIDSKISEKSRSPSVASVLGDAKEPTVKYQSPGVAGEASDLIDVETKLPEKSRSPSVSGVPGDAKEPCEKSKSPSLTREAPGLKDVDTKLVDKSRSPSVTSVPGDAKEPSEKSKSPSISSEAPDLKDIESKLTEKSRSSSVASVSEDAKEPSEKFKSPSVAGEASDFKDIDSKLSEKSRSPSVPSATGDVKEPSEKSKSPSISDEAPDLKDIETKLSEKFRSPSVTGVPGEEPSEKSKSPSIAGEASDLKDIDTKLSEKSRSPSVTSVSGDAKEPSEKSKSPSVAGEASDFKDIDTKLSEKSKSPSVPSATVDAKTPSEKSKSPSISDETPDLKDIETKLGEKSRSPSVTGVPGEEPSEKSKSPSIAGEASDLTGIDTKLSEKSRSPSVTSVSGDAKEPSEKSKSPSVAGEASDFKDIDTKLSEKSRSPSVPSVTGDAKEPSEKSKSPSMADDVSDLKDFGENLTERSRSPSVTGVPGEAKEPYEKSKSLSIVGEAAGLKDVDAQLTDMSKSPILTTSVPADAMDTPHVSKSPGIVGEILDSMDALETTKGDEAKSPSVSGEVKDLSPKSKSPSIADSDMSYVVKVTTLPENADVGKYILDEYIRKKRKITVMVIEELIKKYSISKFVLMHIIETVVAQEKVSRDSVLEFTDEMLEMCEDYTKIVQQQQREREQHRQRDAKDTSEGSISSSLSSELIPSDKSTQDSPVRSESRIDEEISLSEEKRTEVEKLLVEDYLNAKRKITEEILEEIAIGSSLPRYMIIDIIEEVISKRKLRRESVLDTEIYRDDEPEDSYEKDDYRYEKSAESTRYELADDDKEHSYDRKPPEYTDPREGQAETSISDYSSSYETQFRKAFVGGMTEIRTTHITTLSGKSTPDITRGGTPDSVSEPTASTVERAEDKSVVGKLSDSHGSPEEHTTVRVTRTIDRSVADETETVSTRTVTATEQSKIGEPSDRIELRPSLDDKDEFSATEAPMENDERSEISVEGKVIVVKRIVKREVSDQDEPETIRKIIKREIVEQEEPVVITKVIKREVILSEGEPFEPEDPEGAIKVVKEEKIAPSVADTVTAKHILVPEKELVDGENGLSKEERMVAKDKSAVESTRASRESTVTKMIESEKGDDLTGLEAMSTSKETQLAKSVEQVGFTETQDNGDILAKYGGKEKAGEKEGEQETKRAQKDRRPMSPLVRDIAAEVGVSGVHSGRSTPDRRPDGRSLTGTPEGFRAGEVIRTIITTTKTVSDDGEIITTTREVTETTNEKGETVILAEKVDVKVDECLPCKDAAAEPVTLDSQVSGSAPPRGKEEPSAGVSTGVMSSSCYGELPTVDPAHVPVTKAPGLESIPIQRQEDYTFKRFTVEKEYAGDYAEKTEAKKYIDEADLDFEKALTMERKETAGYTNGSAAVKTDDDKAAERTGRDPSTVDSKKDPLDGWGTPLGLPSPIPPPKFNLKNAASSTTNTADQRRTTSTNNDTPLNFNAINDWGEPLRLPSPAPVATEISNKGAPGTPKKEKKQARKVLSENLKNKKRSESPGKNEKKLKDSKNKVQPVYVDLTYVPHHGNSYYTSLEFFKRIRARYYVFSGTEPSREVYDALLEAKRTWEDKDLEVTMIPTYDTDTLGYWVADNEEALAANHIDLSPSASRCTINLQDHETSCSAYRLEF